MFTSGMAFVVVLSVCGILIVFLLGKVNRYEGSYILMGIDSIVAVILASGFHATPFLVRKWCKITDIPIENKLDRYFAKSTDIHDWLRKNKKKLNKL